MNNISKINPIITEAYLTQQKEGQYFERKGLGEKQISPSKIADELIGMLNADGGVLAFGISDSREIQDLGGIENYDTYKAIAFDYIHPPCNVETEEIVLEGKKVLLFHVEQNIEQVFARKDNEKVFLRVLDTNRELNREQIKKLEYDKGIRKFEEEFVKDFDFKDLDERLLADYKQQLGYKGDALDLLVARYLARKTDEQFVLKKAAILLFAKDPEKYIPSASVRYIRYEGNEALTGVNHNVVKDQRFENNIPNLIAELRVFLKTSMKDYYFLDINTGKFEPVAEYPEEAWLEGIVNALCHRSYNVQGNAIYIKHFDNRLEISNSGPLPAQVTIENIKTERFARNPRTARVLEDMGYVRQLNEGVSRIYESMEKSMLSEPEYQEKNGNIYLTLRNKVSSHYKTIHNTVIDYIQENWALYNKTQQKILHYLFFFHEGTVSGFEIYTGVNKTTIKRYLNEFMIQDLIERKSTKQRDLNARYVFKKQ